jgi:hypothetical protein
MIKSTTALFLLLLTAEVRAENVDVKYRCPVDLKTFECRDINRSSFIQRVCYDKTQSYMIISWRGTYYHRRHAGIEPSRRTRVQRVTEEQALGTPEAGAGSMTKVLTPRLLRP